MLTSQSRLSCAQMKAMAEKRASLKINESYGMVMALHDIVQEIGEMEKKCEQLKQHVQVEYKETIPIYMSYEQNKQKLPYSRARELHAELQTMSQKYDLDLAWVECDLKAAETLIEKMKSAFTLIK